LVNAAITWREMMYKPGPGAHSYTTTHAATRRRERAGSSNCDGVDTTMFHCVDTVGDRWTALLVGALFFGLAAPAAAFLRFFADAQAAASPAVLAFLRALRRSTRYDGSHRGELQALAPMHAGQGTLRRAASRLAQRRSVLARAEVHPLLHGSQPEARAYRTQAERQGRGLRLGKD
jgi:hypothetical protein